MDEARFVHLTKNVFVAGGTPRVTYNPRDERHQETEVASFLDQQGKALSVSGPTKSGKTVLIQKKLPRDEAIWIHGSDINKADDFWAHIVDFLGLYDEVEVSTQKATQDTVGIGASVSVKVVQVSGQMSSSDTGTSTVKSGRKRSLASVARDGLSTLSVPIIIDDFHYVPQDVQTDVARAVKSIIPSTPVVLIAVPHEAFEVVRREPDMNGRVWNLRIVPWSEDELRFIATSGFEALNVVDKGGKIAERLSKSSYGAPFLMQQLCYDISVENRIQETQGESKLLREPHDGWESFFARIARRIAPAVFEKLLQGPKTRGQERIDRVFKDGLTTDIYGAVLRAAALTGPKSSISYRDIASTLDQYLEPPIPQGHQISSTLSQMAVIADELRGAGDPAVAYKDGVFYILDPFLAFYLRWAADFSALT